MTTEEEFLADRLMEIINKVLHLVINSPELTTKEAAIKAFKDVQFKHNFEELLK